MDIRRVVVVSFVLLGGILFGSTEACPFGTRTVAAAKDAACPTGTFLHGSFCCRPRLSAGTTTTRASLPVSSSESVSVAEKCPSGWTFEATPNRCYRMVKQGLSWNAAQRKCRAWNGTLANVPSADVGEVIRKIADTLTYNYHIGLSYDAADNAWKWNNGSRLGYANWDPLAAATLAVTPAGFASWGSCARANANTGYWTNEDCAGDDWLWAVCETMPVYGAAPQSGPADAAPPNSSAGAAPQLPFNRTN